MHSNVQRNQESRYSNFLLQLGIFFREKISAVLFNLFGISEILCRKINGHGRTQFQIIFIYTSIYRRGSIRRNHFLQSSYISVTTSAGRDLNLVLLRKRKKFFILFFRTYIRIQHLCPTYLKTPNFRWKLLSERARKNSSFYGNIQVFFILFQQAIW